MSPRTRLLEILNAADLAKLQDAQAASQAQAQAANTGQWVSLLQSVPSVVGGLAGTYQKGVADDAATAAKQAIADNAGATGDHGTKEYAGPTEDGSPLMGPDPTKYAGTAGDVAQKTVSGNAALNPSKPTGIFDSVLSIIGDKEGAAAKARADASAGIASEVQANRDKAATTARQATNDAAENALRTQQIAESGQRMDVEKANADKTNAALAKQQQDEAIRNAVVQAGPGASPFAINKLVGVDVPIADIQAMQDTVARGNAASGASLDEKKAQTANLYAEANQKNAAAKLSANGKPLEEGARKDLAQLQSQLQTVADLQAKSGTIDTGKLASLRNSVAQFVGLDSPEVTEFRAETSGLVNGIIHGLSGGNVTPAEASRMFEQLPRFSDPPEVYRAKIAAEQQLLASTYFSRLNVEKASGANVSGLGAPTSSPTSGPGSNPF